MADRNYSQFLVDIAVAVRSVGTFPDFVRQILITSLNERRDEIALGGTDNLYSAPRALAFFARFLLDHDEKGLRATLLPTLTKDRSQLLVAQLQEAVEDLSVDPENTDSYAKAINKLQKIINIYLEFSDVQQKVESGSLEQAIEEALASLSASIDEISRETRDFAQRYRQAHLHGDDRDLEKLPPAFEKEEKDTPEQEKEKKPLRDKHQEILSTFAKKSRELLEEQKEARQVTKTSLAGQFFSALWEDESAEQKPAQLLLRLLLQKVGDAHSQDPTQVYLWTQDLVDSLIKLLKTFLPETQKKLESLQKETAQALRALALPASGSGAPSSDHTGAEGENEDEAPLLLVDFTSEAARRARQNVLETWLDELDRVADALNRPRMNELYLALGLGREVSVITDDEAQKQEAAVVGVLNIARKEAQDFLIAFEEAATLAAQGKEIDPRFNPPSPEKLNEMVGRALHARLLDAWQTILGEEKPSSDPSNVPIAAIADFREQQRLQEQSQGIQTTQESPQSLAEKIDRISRVQHDILLVAEGELRLKLREMGLQEPQIEKIINDNRPLLLDTIRYKAFSLAADLPADQRLSPSLIVGTLSDEVESFYQKLVVTYSDPHQAGQLSGYFAKADRRTQENIRSGLQALGWSDTEIAEVLSNLEQSRFQPLVAYARQNGYLSGNSGLAGVLTAHNIVQAEQSQAMAMRLAHGDIGALIEPALNNLPREERERVIRDLQRILEKKQRGTALNPEEQAAFNRYITQLLGPESGGALISIMSRLTFADMYDQMAQLHDVLSSADTKGNLQGRRPGLAQPLRAFAGQTEIPDQEATNSATSKKLDDHEKFMLEVALAEAYRRLGEGEGANQAVIEVEIAILVHQYASEAGPQGITAAFYDHVENADQTTAPTSTETNKLAAARQQSYQNRAQQQATNASAQERMQQMQLAMKLMKTGGNPAAIAALLLTDAQARKMLIERLKQLAVPLGVGVVGVAAIPLFVANAIAHFLSNLPIVGGLFSSLFGINAATGAAGSSAAAAQTGQALSGVSKELGRSAVMSGQDAASFAKSQFARSRPGWESSAKSAMGGASESATQMVYNIGSSTVGGWFAGLAILGPLTMASFFTIITITVIGVSMNTMPSHNPFFDTNTGSIDGIGIAGCWPVEGRISTYVHPSSRLSNGERETAIDIAQSQGVAIVTPFAGTAKYISSTTGYGRHVLVETEDGFTLVFGHMSRFSSGSKNGTTRPVIAGEIIGYIGSTGNSTGPHLHYGIFPKQNRGLSIYNITPTIASGLTPRKIQQNTQCGVRSYSASFSQCAGGLSGQPGDYRLPTSCTE